MDFLKDTAGKISATRVAYLIIVGCVMAVWTINSVKAGTMLEIDPSTVGLLVGMAGGKAVQSFAEHRPK